MSGKNSTTPVNKAKSHGAIATRRRAGESAPDAAARGEAPRVAPTPAAMPDTPTNDADAAKARGVRSAKRSRTSRTAPAKRLSGLDAAVQVLGQTGKPLNSADLLERIQSRRLWKTDGKTPRATLVAAMLREIKFKGRESRFRKAGRGLFALTGKGEKP